MGIEPTIFCLRNKCFATKLQRQYYFIRANFYVIEILICLIRTFFPGPLLKLLNISTSKSEMASTISKKNTQNLKKKEKK